MHFKNKVISHPRNIICDYPGSAFGVHLTGIGRWQQSRIGHPRGEQVRDYVCRLPVPALQVITQIQIVMEKLLRFAAKCFHFCGKQGQSLRRVPNIFEAANTLLLHASSDFGDKIIGQRVEHQLQCLLKQQLFWRAWVGLGNGGKMAFE